MDLQTRGRLLVLLAEDHSLVEVAGDDVSIADAFGLVAQYQERDPQVYHSFPHVAPGYGYYMPAWVYAFVPTGVVWDPTSGVDVPEDVAWHLRGGVDITEDVDCFSYGEELVGDEADEVGFSRAVFADGLPHLGWWPVD